MGESRGASLVLDATWSLTRHLFYNMADRPSSMRTGSGLTSKITWSLKKELEKEDFPIFIKLLIKKIKEWLPLKKFASILLVNIKNL